MKESKETLKVDPFLRWAGGKRWLVKHSSTLLPRVGFKRYFEPFLGGGAFFFHLQPTIAVLSDLNSELIETYITLRDEPEKIIEALGRFKNTEEYYYELRQQKPTDPIERSARFIYLNQTSFNGIYRVNLKGEYNVPFGFRDKGFLDKVGLTRASQRLKCAEIFPGDFMGVYERVSKGDLVFLDPPYTVSHNNNGFIKYNQKLFSIEDQLRLSEIIDRIKKVGAYYILTNAAHERIEEIFDKGDTILVKQRASLIGGNNAKRGVTRELVFTNTQPMD